MVSQDPRLTEKVTRWAIEAVQQIPVYIKISPGVTDITSIARAVERGGARAICAIDSLEGVVGVDLKTFSPLPSVQGYSSRGGFTGKAIKPIALRCVADIAETVHIPISGVGGIYNWRDALEFMLLGATTVQVCTAVMQRGYGIIRDLTNGLSNWLDQAGYETVDQIIGLSLPKLTEHNNLPHGIKVISYINHGICIGCGLCYVACADGGHVAILFGSDRKVEVDPRTLCGLWIVCSGVPGSGLHQH